jgi:hypothetical protein
MSYIHLGIHLRRLLQRTGGSRPLGARRPCAELEGDVIWKYTGSESVWGSNDAVGEAGGVCAGCCCG